MTNAMFSFHTYLIAHMAVMVSYILSRAILALPFFKAKLSPSQQLKFVRASFVICILSFLFMPYLPPVFATNTSPFEFQHVLHSASNQLLHQQMLSTNELPQIKITSLSLIFKLLSNLFLIGFIFYAYQYINTLYKLRKFRINSLCLHKINRIHLIFSDIDVPFCWSFLFNHYIAIPISFLQKRDHLHLALRHEFQHIRQGDTHWLQIMALINLLFFFNPFALLWVKWFKELQEFACDEAIILNRKVVNLSYAECLVNTIKETRLLPSGVLFMHATNNVLYRRINMLFTYTHQKRKFTLFCAYVLSFLTITSAAYAVNGPLSTQPLTPYEVSTIIEKSNLNQAFQISATPEVVNQINKIRNHPAARSQMQTSLARMQNYKPNIIKLKCA